MRFFSQKIKNRKVFLMKSVALLILLNAGPSLAYVCTRTETAGPSLGWASRQVDVVLGQKSGGELRFSDLEVASAYALFQWQQAECSDLELSISGSRRDLRAGFDWRAGADSSKNVNLIVLRNGEEQDPIDAWLFDSGAIAITTVTYSRFSGRILDADIELNDGNFYFTECDNGEPGCIVLTDLKNTLTHEVGHLIGLDHPLRTQPDALEATMYGSAAEGDILKRDLAQDDIDGICFLYPTGAATQSCYEVAPQEEPAIVVEEGCAQNTGPFSAAWVLLFFLWFLQRRPILRSVFFSVGNVIK